ncbi:hypothetical protein TNCV_3235331 [Trichonephila clavipes]|nr:hypothetical protein TNCV_3235331 [Trichonephila clavipes]
MRHIKINKLKVAFVDLWRILVMIFATGMRQHHGEWSLQAKSVETLDTNPPIKEVLLSYVILILVDISDTFRYMGHTTTCSELGDAWDCLDQGLYSNFFRLSHSSSLNYELKYLRYPRMMS